MTRSIHRSVRWRRAQLSSPGCGDGVLRGGVGARSVPPVRVGRLGAPRSAGHRCGRRCRERERQGGVESEMEALGIGADRFTGSSFLLEPAAGVFQ